MFTPASTKSILKCGVKSTTKKTAFVTPSHHKPSTGQSNSVLQSKNKSTVTAIQCETNAVTPSTETKSYKNKALDMRYVYRSKPWGDRVTGRGGGGLVVVVGLLSKIFLA